MSPRSGNDLFTPAEELDRLQAVLDFIRQFRQQLRQARTAAERRELQLAIASWERSLEPVATPKRHVA